MSSATFSHAWHVLTEVSDPKTARFNFSIDFRDAFASKTK